MPTDVLKDLSSQVLSKSNGGLDLEVVDDMSAWDTSRRQAFVNTLHARALANAAVLNTAARKILHTARNRRFISEGQYSLALNNLPRYDIREAATASNRPASELEEIGGERAKDIINQMPTLAMALKVMAPHLVGKLAQKEKLTAAAEKLYAALDANSKPIVMSELDQSMTLGAFKKLVLKQDKLRKDIIAKLDQTAETLRKIECAIAEVLVKGVPELSTEILKTAAAQGTRATELGQLARRMSEQVMFGDSKVAQDVLKQYEVDEREMSTEFKALFSNALQKLQLKKGKKQAVLNG